MVAGEGAILDAKIYGGAKKIFGDGGLAILA